MKKYYRLAGFVILAVLLSKIDIQEVIAHFSGMNFAYFAAINLLILPTLFIKSCRWRYILKVQQVEYPAKEAFMSYLGGIFAGIATPGRVGEAVKAGYLKSEKGVAFNKGLTSVFLDRIFDLCMLGVLGYAGLWIFLDIGQAWIGLPVFLVALLVVLAIIMRGKWGLSQDLKSVIKKGISLPVIYTILAYAIYFYQAYLLTRLISIDISYATVVLIVSIAGLVSLLPITVCGLGTREAALAYLFPLLGIGSAKAIAYSFLLFFSFYVVSGMLGFAAWLIKGKRLRR